jgi:hypothetical protein
MNHDDQKFAATPDVNASEISTQINELAAVIEAAWSELHTLGERIDPILRPTDNDPLPQGCAPAEASPFAKTLADRVESLRNLTVVLAQIRSRVDL